MDERPETPQQTSTVASAAAARSQTPAEGGRRAASVRRASAADLPSLAQMLVRAYIDDPVAAWIAKSMGSRARTLHALYSGRLPQMLAHGQIWTDPQRSSAAVWLAPGSSKPRVRLTARLARCLLDPRLAARLPLLAYGLRHMDAAHPLSPPHWYLSLLGTEPASQGQGLGSAVLRPVLERCDAERVGAYLESSKQSNLAFYARHGFREIGVLRLPAGPTLWPMWRDPVDDGA